MDLQSVLDSARPQIEVALEAARDELRECEGRCAEIQGLIRRAEIALYGDQLPPGLVSRKTGRATLHAAIRDVLLTSGDGRLTAAELAAEIARRDLYRRRDARPVTASQIHARVQAYPSLFRRAGHGIIELVSP